MELVAIKRTNLAGPIRTAHFPMSQLTALLGGNDTGKTMFLRAVHERISALTVPRFDDESSDVPALPEPGTLTLFLRVDPEALEMLFEECLRDLTGTGSVWPPGAARTWLGTPLAPMLDSATTAWTATWLTALRKHADEHGASLSSLLELVGLSTTVAASPVTRSPDGAITWSIAWCVPAVAALDDQVRAELGAFHLEATADDVPVALVPVGLTGLMLPPRSLALPTGPEHGTSLTGRFPTSIGSWRSFCRRTRSSTPRWSCSAATPTARSSRTSPA